MRLVSVPTRNGPCSVLRALFTQILLNWLDAQTALPVIQADCQQKRFASRVIIPAQQRRAILSCRQKSIRKQRGTMVGNFDTRRKREKTRPMGTISCEVMSPFRKS